VCGKLFARSDNLAVHRRRIHAEVVGMKLEHFS
jgi:hypothetical protein